MSVVITIKGTPIEFPTTGESPNWAPAVIEFARAVEDAIATAVGPYDIPPQVFNLTINANTDLVIDNLAFPTSVVRAAFIKYAVLRVGSSTISESGNLFAVYDGSAWTLTRDYVGDAGCSFSIDSTGQVKITTSSLAGYTSGSVSFSAQALSQT